MTARTQIVVTLRSRALKRRSLALCASPLFSRRISMHSDLSTSYTAHLKHCTEKHFEAAVEVKFDGPTEGQCYGR